MSQVLEKAQGANNNNSDETEDNDEDNEYSIENDINLSNKIETESYNTSNNTSNNCPLPNIKNTHRSTKKRNRESIYENREHSMSDTSLSDESDVRSPNIINDSSSSVGKKNTCTSAKKRNTPPYGRTKRVRWTDKEKQIILKHFGNYVKELKLPSIRAIQEVIARNPCLQKRSASVVKTWINNQQRSNGLLKKKE